MYSLQAKLEGADQAKRKAERRYAVMSLANKRRYNYYMGKKVGTKARAHVKAQASPDGVPWPKRKRDPKRKVLTRMARTNRLLIRSDADEATVTWRSGHIAQRAAMHQHGYTETVTVGQQRQSPEDRAAGKANKTQLDALRDLGADVAKLQSEAGGLSWLRAGVIIRTMRKRKARTEARQPKRSWQIKYPARPFLGLSGSERREIGQDVFEKINTDIETGRV